MPRRPLIYIPGVSVHVYPRGINGGAIVRDDHDKERLLKAIITAACDRGLSVHAFALMTTHYHVIATPSGKGVLAKTMQSIGIRHTRYFNKK
jgi:putative transposase